MRVRVGVVGLGYWGPNLARNFSALDDCELTWLCDDSAQVREKLAGSSRTCGRAASLMTCWATQRLTRSCWPRPCPPTRSLRASARGGQALFCGEAVGDHVVDAQRAVDAAEQAGRILMVGHLLEYHPAVARLKQLVQEGELGSLYYVYGNRVNLGKLRAEENALWSLGAHDVSVVLHLIGEEPVQCSAHGECYVREGVQDVVFCYLRFPSGQVAHLHLSWLDPHKERRITVVDPGAWPPSTTCEPRASSPSTTRALTRTQAHGANT